MPFATERFTMYSLPPKNMTAQNEIEGQSGMDITTFLVSSVHDMKNSISVMTAYMESALLELPVDAASRSMTYQALYEAQRVNHNMIQLLALYKIHSDMYPFDPVEVELAYFQSEIIARIESLVAAKGIALEVVVDERERNWYFDYELIAALVTQSLHNAVKYTHDRVRLSMRVVDDQLEIRVDDNGEGFPPLMLAQSFPAIQGINGNTGSTGLGLYFAARAAKLHRNRSRTGSTRIENGGTLGGGSFVLRLP